MSSKLVKLPKGISYVVVQGAIAFNVRFMKEGARINLGNFSTVEAAIEAKLNWEAADVKRQLNRLVATDSSQESAMLTGAAIQQATAAVAKEANNQLDMMLALLADEAPHTLFWHKSAMVGNVIIPAEIVNMHLNKLYGLSAAETPKKQSRPAIEQAPEYDWNSVPTEVDPFAAAFLKDQQ